MSEKGNEMKHSPTPKLLPCPFCGMTDPEELGILRRALPPLMRGYRETVVYNGACSCGAMGPDASSRDEAAAAWNRRAPVMQGSECRYSDGAGGCRTSPLVPPSETPCEHVDNPARCRLYRAEGVE